MKTTNVSKFTRLAYVCLPSVIIASAAILVVFLATKTKFICPAGLGRFLGLTFSDTNLDYAMEAGKTDGNPGRGMLAR